HCSAALSVNGWMWMVANRTLIIWRYADDPNARIRSHTLALVATGLQYSADMVCVYKKDSGSLPGVLAVCPEGLVRHWTAPNAAHCDIGIDFRGQVALSLKQVDRGRFLLSTTTDSLYLISVNTDSSGKQANLSVAQLQSRSMASGIGRRMSSLLWGASPVDGVRLLRTVVVGKDTALALTPTTIQVWSLSEERLDHEGNLDLLLVPFFMRSVWNLKSKTEQEHYRQQMRVWLIDVVPYKGGALLLAGAHNQAMAVDVHFGLAFIESLDGPPRSVEWFSLIKLKETFSYRSSNDEDVLFSLRLLCPAESARPDCKQMEGVLVVSKKSVTSLRLPESLDEDSGIIATHSTLFGQEFLGAGCDRQYSYVFLRDDGLMTIRLLPKGFDASGVADSKTLQMSEVRQSSSASSCDEDDGRAALFRMAFIHFAKKEMAKSRASLDELLSGADGSNDVATLAAGLCLAVVDDMPASDPRWVESVGEQQPQKKLEKQLAGSSLLIHYQLIDKRKTLNLVVSFLKTMDLWPKLKGSVSVTEYRRAPTAQSALTEYAEKLECCIELHGATKQKLPACLDDAMRSALQRRREHVPPSLTVQDVFFRRVSLFETVLLGLVEYEQHAITQLATSVERTALIHQVLPSFFLSHFVPVLSLRTPSSS
uniref:Nucleoporin Nup133/Nup155-like N-terminal domain-containing protein n=1 Tax=Plectus sambesii TaxID=2011161 RepID=A0A914XSH7_9BILA